VVAVWLRRYALNMEQGTGICGGGLRLRHRCQRHGPGRQRYRDPQLRVRGVTGLRVVDASVLPVQVAGNTQAPAMAVAWIAADLIREDS
jgi:hypothetical protein